MMDAEKEKMRSELEHHRKSQIYQELEHTVHRLEKSHKRSISTARPYYDLKSQLELQLQVGLAGSTSVGLLITLLLLLLSGGSESKEVTLVCDVDC